MMACDQRGDALIDWLLDVLINHVGPVSLACRTRCHHILSSLFNQIPLLDRPALIFNCSAPTEANCEAQLTRNAADVCTRPSALQR